MIDTINLNVYGLEKYAQIVKQLESPDDKKGVSTIPKAKVQDVEKLKDNYFAGYRFYNDSDTFQYRNYRSVYDLPSSHYSMGFCINRQVHKLLKVEGTTIEALGRIEFSFSLPKAIWRNNVMQFVRYSDTTPEGTFSALMQYIETWRRQFVQVIQLCDIEINRLDICYNQYFLSKADALEYLNQQKLVLPKYSKKGTIRADGLDIVTRRYKFKIYHKGNEFYKHDYKELQKSRFNSGFSVQQLADEADCILRYEVTFRKTMFTYLFWQHYCDGEAAKYDQSDIYSYLFNKKQITGETRPQLDFFVTTDFERYKKIQTDLMAELKEPNLANIRWWLYYRDVTNVKFTLKMFKMLTGSFKIWFNRFQLNTSGSLDGARQKIRQLNEMNAVNKRTRLKDGKRRIIKYQENTLLDYIQYSQKQPLKEKVLLGTLSKSRYYEVMKVFKLMGLNDFNPNFAVAKPSTDYQQYKQRHASWHQITLV